MIDALHISQSGLKANQEWIDQISNNVSNMQTAGYKKSNVQFENLVAPVTASTSSQHANAEQAGLGTRIKDPTIDFTQGPIKNTFRQLDLAISGKGLLEVITDQGDFAYTKLGRLMVNEDGYLATSSGFLLSDQIQVPVDSESIHIAENGKVMVKFADDVSEIEIGEINLAMVTNPESLTSLGDGLYGTNETSGEAILEKPGENGSGTLMQGYLEMANVELVEEMTNLVLAQRAYQLNARLIQTTDQILETVNNLRR
ncbi:Flagellar basal-body rod protein FlgG [Thalassocella blandensis]|nr:Flagellar basal-body rod protein FlgG [Thalassocella blandensis]